MLPVRVPGTLSRRGESTASPYRKQMPRRQRTSDSASALRGTDELYRLLVENVTDYAIFLMDVEGRVATWTEGAERQMGYAEDEILGRHLADLYPPED